MGKVNDQFNKDNFKSGSDFSMFLVNNSKDFLNKNKPKVNSLFIDLLEFTSKRRNSMCFADYSNALAVIEAWRSKLGFNEKFMHNLYSELCGRSSGNKK